MSFHAGLQFGLLSLKTSQQVLSAGLKGFYYKPVCLARICFPFVAPLMGKRTPIMMLLLVLGDGGGADREGM